MKINVKWSDQYNSHLGHNNSVTKKGLQTPSKHYTINVTETWEVSCRQDPRLSAQTLEILSVIFYTSIRSFLFQQSHKVETSLIKKLRNIQNQLHVSSNYVTKHKITC